MKRAFTIVELLMVIGIIAVLATIVTTASMSALQSSRGKRTEAMRVALQAAIATYHAQDSNEKWPGAIENLAENGQTAVLSESQAQEVFREIVKLSTKSSGLPLINPNGLFVAPSGAVDGKSNGMGFADAHQGSKRRRAIGISGMEFGYQGKKTGKFHRFNIVYRGDTDSVVVSAHCHECCKEDGDGALSSGAGCKNSKCRVCHENEGER